tara:strand:- start:3786 stop:5120 length:1335 start_codon:yes stop_codon:yes gene_type:complete
MADKDLKIKTMTGETETIRPTEVNRTSTFLKLAGAAIGSYYLSKQAPEEFEGFTKEIKRQQDVSETDASDQAKAAAGTIGALLTKNALDRNERVNGNLETIDVLVGIGLNSKYAALAAKKGMGKELLAIRKLYPNLDLNTLYQGIDDANIASYSNKDLAKLISGRPTKANIDYSKFKSTSSGIEKLFGYDSSKNLQDRIKRSVDSQDTTQKDELDYTAGADRMSKYGLSKKGMDFLANKDTKSVTIQGSKNSIAKDISNYMGLKVSVTGGQYIYEGAASVNKAYATDIVNAMSVEVEKQLSDNRKSNTPVTGLTRTKIIAKLMGKFFTIKKVNTGTNPVTKKDVFEEQAVPKKSSDGRYLINDLSLDKDKKILPNTWTKTGIPDASTNKPSAVSSNKKTVELTRYKNLVATIKAKPLNLTYTKRMQDAALESAKKQHEDIMNNI